MVDMNKVLETISFAEAFSAQTSGSKTCREKNAQQNLKSYFQNLATYTK